MSPISTLLSTTYLSDNCMYYIANICSSLMTYYTILTTASCRTDKTYLSLFQTDEMPSLVEAIESKYGDDWDSFDKILPAIAIFVPPPRGSLPPMLVFNDCSIDSAGNLTVLQDKCTRIQELDLAQNCLTEWSEVSM